MKLTGPASRLPRVQCLAAGPSTFLHRSGALRPEGTRVPMADKKPPTSWAVVSLVCSILGCLGTVALPAIYSGGMRQEPTGVTAGLAVSCYGFLSVTLGLLGLSFGIVALRRIRRGECGGRGKAWTGIVLGCLPLVVLVAYLAPYLWERLWDWIGNLGGKKQPPI